MSERELWVIERLSLIDGDEWSFFAMYRSEPRALDEAERLSGRTIRGSKFRVVRYVPEAPR